MPIRLLDQLCAALGAPTRRGRTPRSQLACPGPTHRQRRLHALPVGAFHTEAAAGAHDGAHAADQPGGRRRSDRLGLEGAGRGCLRSTCWRSEARDASARAPRPPLIWPPARRHAAAQVTFSPDGRWIISASFDKSGEPSRFTQLWAVMPSNLLGTLWPAQRCAVTTRACSKAHVRTACAGNAGGQRHEQLP